MDDVVVAMERAGRQLAMIDTLYEADLELQRASPTLRAKVNAFLETERAALDHLAARVLAASGVAEAHTHYPLAPDEPRFEVSVDKHMPGVRLARPDVVAVIARHQPFTVPGLGRLRDLLVDVGRQRLVPETKPAPDDVDPPAAPEAAPPAAAAGPEPAAPPPRPGGLMGGLTGPLVINGVEHDPITLLPLAPVAQARRDTVYVDWRFEGDEASALRTLEAVHAAVAAAIADVSAAAGLA